MSIKSDNSIRVRFAPSPTGYLHIGGVRTALYNYLYARRSGGKFILRIEDTDTERSSTEYAEVIFEGLQWLGLDWDEGPFFQSKRLELYNKTINMLMDKDVVYRCYCTPGELKERREEAMKSGGNTGYDGRCRILTEDEHAACEAEGRGYVYRLKTPDSGQLKFTDMVKGEISIDAATISDFVLMKSNGIPTYNFACVVDDSDMGITHVIRGDDHIYNTPKQNLIYQAMEKEPPKYAHLSQVHGTDGKKLSKRTGAVSLSEYRTNGYLPEALRNYLALIGWSTEDSQQIFGWEELIEKFEITRCSTSCGIFDTEKLNWMNGKYIREMDSELLAKNAFFWLKEAKLADDIDNIPPIVIQAIELEKEKLFFLTDIPGRIDYMVKDYIEYDEKAVNKRLKKEGVSRILRDIAGIIEAMGDLTVENLENGIRKYCETNEISAGKVFHPVRVAVSGRMQGPGVFELLQILGKEKVLDRISYALENLVQEG